MAAINQVGNALTGSTGTGQFVGDTSPTLVTPALGTPSSGVLTSCTGLPVAGLANGTDGELITWNSSGVAATVAVGTATHVLTSNGAGAPPTFQAIPAMPYDISFNAGFDSTATAENLVVQDYAQLVMARTGSFTGEAGYLDTVCTGAAVIVDIEKNGTTIYTTKPEFAVSTNALSSGTLKTDGAEDFVSGDRITFLVTQIGSTIAGAGLRFTLKGSV